jgi:hypothetical protein
MKTQQSGVLLNKCKRGRIIYKFMNSVGNSGKPQSKDDDKKKFQVSVGGVTMNKE